MQLGLSYAIAPSCFIDFNYTYAISENYTNHFSAPFTTNLINNGVMYTDSGTLFINTKNQIRTQAVSITLNKLF